MKQTRSFRSSKLYEQELAKLAYGDKARICALQLQGLHAKAINVEICNLPAQ